MPANMKDFLADQLKPLANHKAINDFMTNINGWHNNINREHLTWVGDRFSAIASGLFYKAAQEKREVFEYSCPGKNFKHPDNCSEKEFKKVIFNFLKDVEDLGLTKLVTISGNDEDEPDATHQQTVIYHSDNSALMCGVKKLKNYSFNINISSFDKSLVDKVKDLVNKYADLKPKNPDLFVLSEDEEGHLSLFSIGKPGIPFEKGNYNDDVINDFEYISEQLVKKDPFGRLVIMHGPPGTGKTHLLKSFIHNLQLEKVKFIFLQPEFLYRFNITALTRVLINACSDGSSIVLIIEDADECLVPRQSDNMAAISTLLNFADGFVGNLLDIRIIATTNAKQFDIDKALKRAGRLCRIVNVGPLTVEKANSAYCRITGKDISPFTQPVTLSEIYAETMKNDGISTGPDSEFNNTVGFSKSTTND